MENDERTGFHDNYFGRLYLVSTPIGNLGDVTIRALDTLRTVNLILSEDTRQTRKLLQHYQVRTKQLSYHDSNKEKVIPLVINKLKNGDNIALVSDAGTPAISDPGYLLVRNAIESGIDVISIPGASAVLAALVVSGLPTDKFLFLGFLPGKKTQRRKRLEEASEIKATLIFYESPYRLAFTLNDMLEVLGNRRVAICRELTKIHEEVRRGTLTDILAQYVERDIHEAKLKGEIVVVLEADKEDRSMSDEEIKSFLKVALRNGNKSTRDLVTELRNRFSVSRNRVYNLILKEAKKDLVSH